MTEPAQEYLAQSELHRFDLEPYLPQRKRRWRAVSGSPYIERKYPLFPRYLLLPFNQLDRRLISSCKGIYRSKPLLGGTDGIIWRAPDRVIQEIMAAEDGGKFDETLREGDYVVVDSPVFSGIPTFIEKLDPRTVALVTPLFGGARLRIKREKVTRSLDK